ncbi:unnamed protein product [Ceutorhynchus assimilis]|uniref:Glycerol kinase 5 n=1 Tax=Ceutorhynchus assimilis TaxID=467358 RepID=A0A9N9MM28_9CUCU|nr:unnamed protein product [Ceutorhynchus assimilis]
MINKLANSYGDLSIKQVNSLAISTQRGTFITWRKDTGVPLHNFITWKDLRAAELIKQINGSWKMMALRTGSFLLHFLTRITKLAVLSHLKFASSHVTIRLLWFLQNHPEVQKALQEQNLMFGTLDTWLIYKLTKGKFYVTDISNASATGMFDPFSLCWSFLPKIFKIPIDIFPMVVDNSYDFGEVTKDIFGEGIKIGAVMSDQSASMYGSCCFNKNDIKVTLGTGAFLNLNTAERIQGVSHGMYPLVGWKNENEVVYLAEVACSDAGSLMQWMLAIGLISNSEESSYIANSVKDNGGVYFIPAFSGLGPPINNESAATGFIGIKPTTNKAHMIRAVLESIAYKIAMAYDLLNSECPTTSLMYIKADGGVSKNDFICQLLANLTNLNVKRSKFEMATLGVAYFAGQSCGFWKSKEDILKIDRVEDVFKPTENQTLAKELRDNLENWQRAADRFTSWYK